MNIQETFDKFGDALENNAGRCYREYKTTITDIVTGLDGLAASGFVIPTGKVPGVKVGFCFDIMDFKGGDSPIMFLSVPERNRLMNLVLNNLSAHVRLIMGEVVRANGLPLSVVDEVL